jgi:15-cis-phytoene synthase
MALAQGISSNPVLHAFQQTVREYQINPEHVESFLSSMTADLSKKVYSSEGEMKWYIYGSADVVGLMCLSVFCKGDPELYKSLEIPAMKLGSAFQKVNFLRDLKNDTGILGRTYFPQLDGKEFDGSVKDIIESDIQNDFNEALMGIERLPGRSKLAVLVAFYYYQGLLRKIRKTPAKMIISKRIRLASTHKLLLLIKAMFVYGLGFSLISRR